MNDTEKHASDNVLVNFILKMIVCEYVCKYEGVCMCLQLREIHMN